MMMLASSEKATMTGLVQYLLENPAGEPPSYIKALWAYAFGRRHGATWYIFIAHLALISSQDVLRILVGKFKEASGDIRDGRRKVGTPPFALF